MGSILTFDCGCFFTINAIPESDPLTAELSMRYHLDTVSWCANHKDQVRRGLMQHLTKETEQVTQFIENWYFDRKQSHPLGYDEVQARPKTDKDSLMGMSNEITEEEDA